MIAGPLFRIVDTLRRYLVDAQCDIISVEGVRKRLTRVQDDVESVQRLADTDDKSGAQYTIPQPLNDEDFARLIRKHELHEREDGSFIGNYYGIFPNRTTVERVLGGPAEQIAYQKAPFRQIYLYQNKNTGEYHQQYWAKSCGDAYHSSVQDLPSWLADIGEDGAVHVEFTDSNLVAFNLPKGLWDRVERRASTEELLPTAWLQRVLEAYLRNGGDTMTGDAGNEPSQACPDLTSEQVQAVVKRIRQRAIRR